MMRLAIRICGTLLALVCLAQSQEPQSQDRPERAPSRRDIRLGRTPSNSPFYPDPAPAGSQANPMRPMPPPNATQPPSQPSPPANASGANPQPSAPQPSLEQLGPPTPPQVTYLNGELTIRALNSTLESVLTAIRNKAGIQFEGLEGGAPERVVIALGPAPEGEVLAALLGGSRFDYVAVDRPDSPGIVQRVVLSPRPGGTATAGAQRQPPSSSSSGMESGDEDEVPDEGANADPDTAPQDTPARPPVMQAQPQMQLNPPPQQQQPQNQQPPSQTSNPKTPEQLLEELKQMQQRQQQQQQQQQPRSPHDQPPQ